MTMRRISALLALVACLGAAAADSPPPSAPVSDEPPKTDTTQNTDAAKPASDASKAAPKPVPESKGEKTADGDFKPSEEISEDMAVAYPVDI